MKFSDRVVVKGRAERRQDQNEIINHTNLFRELRLFCCTVAYTKKTFVKVNSMNLTDK